MAVTATTELRDEEICGEIKSKPPKKVISKPIMSETKDLHFETLQLHAG